MAKFLSRLVLTAIDDEVFALHDPFEYNSDLLAQTIKIPVGFYTDFASVPRLGILYAALGNCARAPAVVHDWLYYAGITDRATADEIFYEAMEVSGISIWRRHPIYWGVRIGGWAAWNNHRKQGHSAADAEKLTERFINDQTTGYGLSIEGHGS